MEDKTSYNLGPSLMKKPLVVDYWKLNEIAKSGERLRQKHQFVNFWGKTLRGNYGKREMGEESIKSMKWHTPKGGYSKSLCMRTRGRGVVIIYVRPKWMGPNKCCGIFFVHWFDQVTRASLPARKISLFSAIIFTMILSYPIIRA